MVRPETPATAEVWTMQLLLEMTNLRSLHWQNTSVSLTLTASESRMPTELKFSVHTKKMIELWKVSRSTTGWQTYLLMVKKNGSSLHWLDFKQPRNQGETGGGEKVDPNRDEPLTSPPHFSFQH